MEAARLENAAHHYRVIEVPVPELEGWGFFGDGEPLVWKVRNLHYAEIHIAARAPERDRMVQDFVGKVVAGGDSLTESILELSGVLREEVPDNVRKDIDTIVLATQFPAIGWGNRPKIVELSETQPVVFTRILLAVNEATNGGSVLGKPQPSGQTPASD